MRAWQTTLVAAGLAVLAVLAAGCVGSSDPGDSQAANETPDELPEPVTVLTDPEGDQREKNSGWIQNTAPCLQAEDAPQQPPCRAPGTPVDDAEPAGGVPTSPARDILEVRFQETPDTLEVFLDVGELSEGFGEAVDGENSTWYFIAWNGSGDRCRHAVGFYLHPMSDRLEVDSGAGAICEGGPEEGANTSQVCPSPLCFWDVPFEVDFGAPATLHWSVPRDALPADAGDELRDPIAVAEHNAGRERTVSMDGRLSMDGAWGPGAEGYAYDRGGSEEAFAFQTDRRSQPLETGRLELTDGDDVDVEPEPSRPDLQIDRLTFEPGPRAFRFVTTLEEVSEPPRNHTLFLRFGIPGGSVTAGYEARDGERSAFANLFPPGGSNPVSIPVGLRIEPGTPGTVHLELARGDLPPVAEGASLQVLWAITWAEESQQRPAAGAGTVEASTLQPGDWSASAPFHGLSAGVEAEEDPTVRIADAVGDVEPPPDLTEPRDRYDLHGTEVVSRVPDEMRFSISVADLSDPDPPPEYDAVFYAVGVEHPNGETMLGHYRSRDRPGGEFLCAPDTTVLADDPADPTQSAWTTVEGTLQTASSGGGRQGTDGGAGSAALLVTAPPSCFGLTEGAEELNVTHLEAGSYLVRRSQADTSVEELDAMAAEEGFVAPFAEPIEEQPSFWAQPFGVDNFWDIVGVTLAAITVIVSVGLFYRRRRAFHRYLDEIQRIQEDYRHNPSARAAALVELRRRLRRDLEAHRVNDSHYPIILDRLRTRLTSARLTSLGQGFYEIPSRISLRIERLLDDGYLSEEEAEVLEPVIKESDMPNPQAAELVDRLHKWVEEDAREAAE